MINLAIFKFLIFYVFTILSGPVYSLVQMMTPKREERLRIHIFFVLHVEKKKTDGRNSAGYEDQMLVE